jgi:hypothetical protein
LDAEAPRKGIYPSIRRLEGAVPTCQNSRVHWNGRLGRSVGQGDPATAVVRWEMVEPLAKRIADLDWHLQFNVVAPKLPR